jgi:uncharacterized protein (TIGR02449 family)
LRISQPTETGETTQSNWNRRDLTIFYSNSIVIASHYFARLGLISMEPLIYELEHKVDQLIFHLNLVTQENKKFYLSEQKLLAEKEVLSQQNETAKQKVAQALNRLKSSE